jgi:hypothetical protein
VKHTLFVPIRTSDTGTLILRTGRLRSGERVGLAFSSEASLLLALGPSQAWIHLGGQALKDMLAPLGIKNIRIDPHPVAELEVAIRTPARSRPRGRPGQQSRRAGSSGARSGRTRATPSVPAA